MNVSALWRVGRFDKPIGSLLLLWPTLGALVLASGLWPSTKLIAIFTAGVLLMRTAGCIINDIADRDFDGSVERTQNRPLATKELPVRSAAIMMLVLLCCAFTLVLLTNKFTVKLSVVALLLAACYPLMKRFFAWPQLVLGAAFAWGVPMAFSATLETIPPTAWLFFASVVTWVFAYDTLYGMVDREDDKKLGLRSSAITLGKYDLYGVACAFMITLLLWTSVGILAHLNMSYFIGLCAACAHMTWQLISAMERQREKCFRAFYSNHILGVILLLSIILGSL